MDYIYKEGKIVEVEVTLNENDILNNIAMKNRIPKKKIICSIIKKENAKVVNADDFKLKLIYPTNVKK